MSRESPKRTLLSHFAAVAKAIGHAHRLKLLELLAQGERSVESLAEIADLSVGNASQHLQRLRRAGLLTSRHEGKHVFYRLTDESIVDLLAALRRIPSSRHQGESLAPLSFVRRAVPTVHHPIVHSVTERFDTAELKGAKVTLEELE